MVQGAAVCANPLSSIPMLRQLSSRYCGIEESSRGITLPTFNQSNSDPKYSFDERNFQTKMLSQVNFLAVILFSLLITSTEAFQRPRSHTAPRSLQSTSLKMVSGNKANFGIFSPAVVAAKFILGEAKLNKVEEDRFFSCSSLRTNSNAMPVISFPI
jgi:hypothetical protein